MVVSYQKVIMLTIEFQPGFATNAPESGPADSSTGKRAHRRAHAAKRAATDPRKHIAADSAPDTAADVDTAPDRPADAEAWAESRINDIRLFASSYEHSGDILPESLSALIDARTRLAEISVTSREGKLISNKRADKKFDRLTDAYIDAKNAFVADELAKLTEHDDTLNTEQKAAFVAMLNSKEDGALMGEEAQYYLVRHHYDRSRLQRTIERYNGLNRWQKVAVGVGAAAVGSLLAGLTAGGAAIGTVAAVRFGRAYFRQEAKRRGADSNPALSAEQKLMSLQQNSTLKGSNADLYRYTHAELKTAAADSDGKLISAYGEASRDVHLLEAMDRADEEQDRAKETRQKRLALAKAAGTIAVGTAIGFLAEHINAWNEGSSSEGQSGTSRASTGNGEQFPLGNNPENGASGVDANEPAADNAPDSGAPAASPESQTLFGEFAGSRIDLSVPEGSNVWDQLEATVDQRHPFMPFAEKQRLVSNMVAKLQEQYPNRNLDLVRPGESFSFELNT